MSTAEQNVLERCLHETGLSPEMRTNIERDFELAKELAELRKTHAILDGEASALEVRMDTIEIARRELGNARHNLFMRDTARSPLVPEAKKKHGKKDKVTP